ECSILKSYLISRNSNLSGLLSEEVRMTKDWDRNHNINLSDYRINEYLAASKQNRASIVAEINNLKSKYGL
ncbi:MAG: hypothetical protein ACTSRA_22630, partial [Promethearchaeota archaeon]